MFNAEIKVLVFTRRIFSKQLGDSGDSKSIKISSTYFLLKVGLNSTGHSLR